MLKSASGTTCRSCELCPMSVEIQLCSLECVIAPMLLFGISLEYSFFQVMTKINCYTRISSTVFLPSGRKSVDSSSCTASSPSHSIFYLFNGFLDQKSALNLK